MVRVDVTFSDCRVLILELTSDNINSINEKVSHDFGGLMLSLVLALTTLEMQHEDVLQLKLKGRQTESMRRRRD